MKLLVAVVAVFIIIVIGHTVIVAQPDAKAAAESMKAPVAKKDPKVLKIHGYEIVDFGIKEVVPGNQSKDVSFKVDKAGIFAIKCQLHPAHVVGQLLVLD